jgi:hypothetical protein
MKTINFLKILCVILFTGTLCGCFEYPPYEITSPPFVNATALNIYVGDEVQITASPSNAAFKWSSDNESVATVSQSGVVTALDEGLATISVASENDKTDVDVRVRIFVPLTDVNISKQAVTLFGVSDKVQIWASTVPENASENTFTWRSADPSVATVNNEGLITAVRTNASTTVTVRIGSFVKVIEVTIIEAPFPKSSVWVTGNGTNAEWNGDRIELPFDEGNPWVFVYEGPLKVGEIKFLLVKNNWDANTIRPMVANGSITSTDMQVYPGGTDLKWKVLASEVGNYRITIDLINLKIYFVKL